ncbi:MULTISPECIES: hypothetical protein [Pseudonocardia]|nr:MULTISPECIES: hypothetical protein [Pseudonocardia]
MTDQQIIASGSAMCAYPESLTTTGFENDAPPEYVEYSKVTAAYCDVLPPEAADYDGGAANQAAVTTPEHVALNQRFDVYDSTGVKMFDAAFTAINVDADCSESAKYLSEESQPARGHFVTVSMDIATTPDFQPDKIGYPTEHDFTFTGADGYTDNAVDAPTAYCVPQDDTLSVMTPANKYRGALTLDLKSSDGSLTYKSHFDSNGTAVTIDLP